MWDVLARATPSGGHSGVPIVFACLALPDETTAHARSPPRPRVRGASAVRLLDFCAGSEKTVACLPVLSGACPYTRVIVEE